MTSTEVALRPTSSLAEKIAYATELAQSDLLPKDYKDNPANILLVMEFGEYLGLPPMAAIRLVHIIDNKPTASAELIAGRVRMAGHKLRVTYDHETKSATCSIWRKDDPGFEFTATWTWEQAATVVDRFGKALTQKPNWKNYPGPMLKWRATTECARDACPEILLGVSYTAEELGAYAITDDEADDIGVMNTHQRTEHTEIRRMGESPAGAVIKLERVPDDDEFYADRDGFEPPADRSAMGQALTDAAIEDLRALNRQVLGTWTEADVKALYERHLGEPFRMGSEHVAIVTKLLDDALRKADGDGELASMSLWSQFHPDGGDA